MPPFPAPLEGVQRGAESHSGLSTVLFTQHPGWRSFPSSLLAALEFLLTRHEFQETGFIFSTQVSLQGLDRKLLP